MSTKCLLSNGLIFLLALLVINLSWRCVAAGGADNPMDAGTDRREDRNLPETVSFNAHIRPIMSDTCFTCHGPDEDENQSALRLDSLAAAVDEGEAIEPGDAEASLVYQRLVDADNPMPPADFRHQLSPYEIALFRRWIDQGAHYQPHWSYAPLQRPAIPPINDPSCVANEIDAFIVSRLARESIEPAAKADKATLLRRLSLDLIGLPPTPAELTAFLADDSIDAYEKQVDRLLASPRYGERMASQWLDAVRFTDTVGYHGDQNQHVFAYRDYVINSLNANKPFDQFTREQLAGDLLPNPTDEQRIATAMTRLNMMTREGGAQPEEYLAKYTADRVRVLGTAWLGLTTGCCECHNHKYDPLSAKDFYSLGAFFDDLRQWGVYTTYDYTPNPDLAGFSNDSPFPPELRSPSTSLHAQIEHLETSLMNAVVANTNEATADDPDFLSWVRLLSLMLKQHPDGWLPIKIDTAHTQSGATNTEILDDASVRVIGPVQPGDSIEVSGKVNQLMANRPMMIKAIRVEVLPDERHNGQVGRAAEGRFALDFSAAIGGNDKQSLNIAFTQVDRLSPNRYVSGTEPWQLNGQWRSGPAAWQFPVEETKLPHTAVYQLASPHLVDAEDELVFKLDSNDLGRVRISVSPLTRFVAGMPAADERLKNAVEDFEQDPSGCQQSLARLLAAYYLSNTPANEWPDEVKTYRNLIGQCRSGYAMTMVAGQAEPEKWRQSRVLPRGNWQDQTGDLVVPDTPDFLPKLPSPDDRRLTRLDLANWLTSNENPLTSRHYVNRTWKHFFGSGLSNKLDDLGNQGEWPSHPELLDWLAAEFRERWDMKHLNRLIVTSNTYQQRVLLSSQAIDIDPFNRLLSQQSPRRLEAEAIRDNALAISGLLFDDYVGGPSVFPYQPANYYSNLQFPDRDYSASPVELQYRRGVYMHWQRTFLHPMLVNFDAPLRDECVADRNNSNSPQQALTLLNDPEFVEASIAFADKILRENRNVDFSERLDIAFLRALARPATALEREGLQALYMAQKKYFTENEEEALKLVKNKNFKRSGSLPPPELAAWSQVVRVILNLHETITRF